MILPCVAVLHLQPPDVILKLKGIGGGSLYQHIHTTYNECECPIVRMSTSSCLPVLLEQVSLDRRIGQKSEIVVLERPLRTESIVGQRLLPALEFYHQSRFLRDGVRSRWTA